MLCVCSIDLEKCEVTGDHRMSFKLKIVYFIRRKRTHTHDEQISGQNVNKERMKKLDLILCRAFNVWVKQQPFAWQNYWGAPHRPNLFESSSKQCRAKKKKLKHSMFSFSTFFLFLGLLKNVFHVAISILIFFARLFSISLLFFHFHFHFILVHNFHANSVTQPIL